MIPILLFTSRVNIDLRSVSESNFCENSELVVGGNLLVIGFREPVHLVTVGNCYHGNILCETNLLAGRFSSTNPEFKNKPAD